MGGGTFPWNKKPVEDKPVAAPLTQEKPAVISNNPWKKDPVEQAAPVAEKPKAEPLKPQINPFAKSVSS